MADLGAFVTQLEKRGFRISEKGTIHKGSRFVGRITGQTLEVIESSAYCGILLENARKYILKAAYFGSKNNTGKGTPKKKSGAAVI